MDMLNLRLSLSKSIFIAIITIMCACSSSQKYTYNFSHYDYQAKSEKLLSPPLESSIPSATEAPENLTASKDGIISPSIPLGQENSTDLTSIKNPPLLSKETLPNGLPLKKAKDYTKAEKKMIRKDFRAEKKVYKKAKKEGNVAQMAESEENLTGYTRSGVIIGAAGLILIIIGSVSSSVLVAIGAVALVAGLVLIVIDNV